jgi:hypothetical protein
MAEVEEEADIHQQAAMEDMEEEDMDHHQARGGHHNGVRLNLIVSNGKLET